MKLTNNRLYLDFNATSPLAETVKSWLARGEFLFANPSSIHSSGKSARRSVNEVTEYLYQLFGLSEDDFDLIYHSGATEGMSMLIQGRAAYLRAHHEGGSFFYASSDHSCVVNQVPRLEAQGLKAFEISVDDQGELDPEVIGQMSSNEAGPNQKFFSFTWVNNETGVVWDLKKAKEIKEQTGASVFVDAVQSVGKIDDWNKLDPSLDAYTFSGHKFGALKGVGFSFIKKDLKLCPLVMGGGQQQGMRSGTENTFGIVSLKYALEELHERQDLRLLQTSKQLIEQNLHELIGDKGEIIAAKAPKRNHNTICFRLNGVRADQFLTAFDLAGIDVSTGSACSSGAVAPSRVLLAMGKSTNEAKSSLRLSFAPYLNTQDAIEFSDKINKVVSRFL